MNGSLLKSTGAILAGLILEALLSIATDTVLEKAGWMKTDPFAPNSGRLIFFAVLYRIVFNVRGSFLKIGLAPSKPMKHDLILGFIGSPLATAGAILMRDVPPRWYSFTVAFISIPSAWLGGVFALRINKPLYHH